MEYVLGALVGIIYGGVIGLCKYIFLWRSILHPKTEADRTVYIKMGISYFVNIATLCIPFFARNILPFDFAALIIATAAALSFMGRFLSSNKFHGAAETEEH